MRTRRALAILGFGAHTALCACGSSDSVLAPVARLADLPRDGRAAPAPIATLGDVTRTVLLGHAERWIVNARRVAVPPDRRVVLRSTVPSPLYSARRLLLSPRFRNRERWRPLPRSVVHVEGAGGAAVTGIAIEMPATAAPEVDVTVHAVAVPEGREREYVTAPVAIPAHATLEFGVGVLEPAWPLGPVAFAIEVCEHEICEPLFETSLDPGRTEGRSWRDHALPLDEFAGSERSFRFRTRVQSRAEDAFSLPVWADPNVLAPAPRGEDAFNLIILSVDTLRADFLTSYGYPDDTAPFLDAEFARGGTLFENLVASAATTGPSHMSMFTALTPSAHGVTRGGRVLSPGATTLAEALRRQGFATGAVTEGGTLNAWQGFGRGFDFYAENPSPHVFRATGQVDVTFAAARRWLARQRDRRFFLFLHTFQVHAPYSPPGRYAELFPRPAPGHEMRPGLPPDRDPRLYAREIRYVDDELRSLFATLVELDLDESTVFVVTSDHGDEFLEHGYWGHGAHVHAEITRVPLLIRGPGIPRGLRVARPVSHVDLMPTLLDLAGAPPVPGGMGHSFADVLRGSATGASAPERPLYSEAWYPRGRTPDAFIAIEQPTLAVRVGSRKLIRFRRGGGFAYAYYDLAADPEERFDRHGDHPEEARDLRALVDAYAERARAMQSAREQARGGPGAPDTVPATLDPEREEKLRALGYVD